MPRALGQIDETKRTAILEAAAQVFAENGLAAPLEHIASRAGVSRQTLYNQFGGREALLQALIEARRSEVVASLEAPGAEDRLEETLTAYAAALMRRWTAPGSVALMRVAAAAAGDRPELARLIHEAGPRAARTTLAAFLRREHDLGRLAIPDPDNAAEIFAGMASGALLLQALLTGAPALRDDDIETRSRECARRFIAAYGS